MITRTLRGLGALTVLAVLLIGWPVALLALAGTVAKWLPDLSNPAGLLARPDAGGLFLLIVLVLGWIAWGVWATALLVEAAAQARGIPTPRLGGLFPQHAAAALVTAIAVAFAAAPTPALAAPSASPPPTAATAPVGAAASHTSSTPDEAPAPTGDEPRDYTVAPGDTLWDIADEQLDDPLRWTEIAEASRKITQSDGRRLDAPGLIRPGWTLKIPTDPEPAADVATQNPHTAAPAAEGEGVTLPTTPFQQPTPASSASEPPGEAGGSTTAPAPASPSAIDDPDEIDHAGAANGGITLPPTPLRPPEPAEAFDDAETVLTHLPSTPLTAGVDRLTTSETSPSAATIDDEGRSQPVHGILGLPDWISDPLIPTCPEDATDLIAAISADTGAR